MHLLYLKSQNYCLNALQFQTVGFFCVLLILIVYLKDVLCATYAIINFINPLVAMVGKVQIER